MVELALGTNRCDEVIAAVGGGVVGSGWRRARAR